MAYQWCKQQVISRRLDSWNASWRPRTKRIQCLTDVRLRLALSFEWTTKEAIESRSAKEKAAHCQSSFPCLWAGKFSRSHITIGSLPGTIRKGSKRVDVLIGRAPKFWTILINAKFSMQKFGYCSPGPGKKCLRVLLRNATSTRVCIFCTQIPWLCDCKRQLQNSSLMAWEDLRQSPSSKQSHDATEPPNLLASWGNRWYHKSYGILLYELLCILCAWLWATCERMSQRSLSILCSSLANLPEKEMTLVAYASLQWAIVIFISYAWIV